MSQDIASLVLRVDSLEARNATADIKKLGQQGKATEGIFAGFGKTLAGIGIGTGIGMFLGAIVKNTIEAEQATAQLEARLKSTQGASGMTVKSLQDLATGLMGVTTFGDEAIQGAEALMLTFTKIHSEVFPQAIKAALDMSTALGTDLNGATLQLSKALNDPIKGITALSRAGVQFTADQKAMIKTMVEAGNTAGAQKLILGELETQMGGAAEAARNTLGGAIEGLKNSFGELLEGDSGGEGVKGATGAINDLATQMASPEMKNAFGAVVKGLFDIISFAGRAMVAVNGLNQALHDSRVANAAKSYDGLLARYNELDSIIKNGGGLSKEKDPLGALFGLGRSKEKVDAAKKEMAEVQKLLVENRRIQQAPGPKPATSGVVDATGAAAAREAAAAAAKAAKAGAKGAQSAADAAAKAQASALDGLRKSLATEEEAINASYEERSRVIAASTKLTEDDRARLSQRSLAMRDEEMAALHEKDAAEFESLRMSLRTEEEVIKESYDKRMAIIAANTVGHEAQAAELATREKARRDEDLAALAAAEQSKRDQLSQGLLTEEEMLKQYHERRRQEILDSTLLTETERQDLLRREETKFMEESANRERERLAMLTSATGDMFGALSSLMATYAASSGKQGAKMFKIAQALSIAQAVMSVATGIAEAQKLGFPMNIIEGIRVAAVGAVQLATIRSQKFSGAHDDGGYIPAGKWGIVGERGPERVRGPAMVTSRVATARALREESRKSQEDPRVSRDVTNNNRFQISVYGDIRDRKTADHFAAETARQLQRVQRNRG